MDAPLTRRGLAGAVAAAALTAGAAQGSGVREPAALLGRVSGGEVSLPKLDTENDLEGRLANPDPPGRRLGVAVVGLGHLALGQILPGFGQARHVRVTALVSGEPDKARVVAAQYGVPSRGLYDYATFDRLRDNPDVDIVYIVLPNNMHAEFTARAAQAGKHVLCEKPMASTVADAQRMIDACRAANKRLMIAYRMQYEPYNRALMDLVRGGDHGPLQSIIALNGQDNANNGQWRHDREMAGGGALPDVGIYCLNAARYLTGREPIEITAQLTRPRGDGRFTSVEDQVSFALRFPGDVMATCMAGYSFHATRMCRAMTPEAWYGLDPAFDYGNLSLQIGRRAGAGLSVETRRFDTGNQFAIEMDAFAEALRAGRAPRTPGEEGLQDLRLIAAIYQAAEGGSAVKLAEVPGMDVFRGPLPPRAQV